MNAAADALRMAVETSFDMYGVQVIHTPKNGDPIQRRILLDEGVQRMGERSGVMETFTEISVLRCEGPKPKRGDVFTDGDLEWKVDGEVPAGTDAHVVVVSVT